MEPIENNTETEVPKSILEQTNEAIVKLKSENERMEKNITELANEKLGGTGGGNIPVQQPKEESNKEFARRIEREIAEGKHNG